MSPIYVMYARTPRMSPADFHRMFYTPITYLWLLFPIIGVWSAVVAIRRVAAAIRYKPSVLTTQGGGGGLGEGAGGELVDALAERGDLLLLRVRGRANRGDFSHEFVALVVGNRR